MKTNNSTSGQQATQSENQHNTVKKTESSKSSFSRFKKGTIRFIKRLGKHLPFFRKNHKTPKNTPIQSRTVSFGSSVTQKESHPQSLESHKPSPPQANEPINQKLEDAPNGQSLPFTAENNTQTKSTPTVKPQQNTQLASVINEFKSSSGQKNMKNTKPENSAEISSAQVAKNNNNVAMKPTQKKTRSQLMEEEASKASAIPPRPTPAPKNSSVQENMENAKPENTEEISSTQFAKNNNNVAMKPTQKKTRSQLIEEEASKASAIPPRPTPPPKNSSVQENMENAKPENIAEISSTQVAKNNNNVAMKPTQKKTRSQLIEEEASKASAIPTRPTPAPRNSSVQKNMENARPQNIAEISNTQVTKNNNNEPMKPTQQETPSQSVEAKASKPPVTKPRPAAKPTPSTATTSPQKKSIKHIIENWEKENKGK